MANPHDHRPGDPHSLHPPGLEEQSLARVAAVPLVELVDVSNGYGTTPALTRVSLKIWPGQFMAIVGTHWLRAAIGNHRLEFSNHCRGSDRHGLLRQKPLVRRHWRKRKTQATRNYGTIESRRLGPSPHSGTLRRPTASGVHRTSSVGRSRIDLARRARIGTRYPVA